MMKSSVPIVLLVCGILSACSEGSADRQTYDEFLAATASHAGEGAINCGTVVIIDRDSAADANACLLNSFDNGVPAYAVNEQEYRAVAISFQTPSRARVRRFAGDAERRESGAKAETSYYDCIDPTFVIGRLDTASYTLFECRAYDP